MTLVSNSYGVGARASHLVKDLINRFAEAQPAKNTVHGVIATRSLAFGRLRSFHDR